MKFRTELTPEALPEGMAHGHCLLAMGSCFADRMGERLAASKFDLVSNPLGMAYHPLSLARLLSLALDDVLPPLRYAPHLATWHSFALHSRFNDPERRCVEAEVRRAYAEVQPRLARLDWLLLTFGTAWAYRLREDGQLVNNNHRYPSDHFDLELLEPTAIVAAWRALIERLRRARPHLRVICTVSPVRHVRHTLTGNSVSKAVLRLACHQLAELPGVAYFPAFELLTDDLRDYRFYGVDLVHPTEMAEAYIWEKFAQACLSPEAQAWLREWETLQRDLNHRPRQPRSEAQRQFLRQLDRKLQALSARGIDLTRERQLWQRLWAEANA